MQNTFNRNQVVQKLREMISFSTAVIGDGKGRRVTVCADSSGLFTLATRPDMRPKSLDDMADWICRDRNPSNDATKI